MRCLPLGPAARWRALRPILFAPSHARVLAPLIPVYDVAQDRIGFWRLTLPRLSWRLALGAPYTRRSLPDDPLPDQPFALGIVQQVRQNAPALARHLADEGNTSAAREMLQRALRENPDYAPAGALLQQLGDR